MPIYVYKCENNHKTEIFQGINSKPMKVCPQCGGKVKKEFPKGTTFKFASKNEVLR